MTHRDDAHHSARWRWALALAAAALILWAAMELRDMNARVQYLERQAERLMWQNSGEALDDIQKD